MLEVISWCEVILRSFIVLYLFNQLLFTFKFYETSVENFSSIVVWKRKIYYSHQGFRPQKNTFCYKYWQKKQQIANFGVITRRTHFEEEMARIFLPVLKILCKPGKVIPFRLRWYQIREYGFRLFHCIPSKQDNELNWTSFNNKTDKDTFLKWSVLMNFIFYFKSDYARIMQTTMRNTFYLRTS